MSRSGAILIPLLGGFLLTVAMVSWRSGWWEQRDAPESSVTPRPKIEPRRSHLRVVDVSLAANPFAAAASKPVAPAPVPAAPEAAPEPVSQPLTPPPVPRVDPGNSPELLEAPARKFARGSRDQD